MLNQYMSNESSTMAMLASAGANEDVLFIHAAMVRTRIRAVTRHCAVLKSSEPSSLRDLSTKRYSKASPVVKLGKLIKYTTIEPYSRYSSVGLSVGVMPNDVNYKIKNL